MTIKTRVCRFLSIASMWLLLLLWSLFPMALLASQYRPPASKEVIELHLLPPTPRFYELPTEYARAQQYCLAQNIYFEARGEPLRGQYAVGFVTINRLRSSHFPYNLCGVVYQQRLHVCQFSWHCDKYADHPHNDACWHRAQMVASGIWEGYYRNPLLLDTTQGALFFFNPHKVAAKVDVNSVVTIGHQTFYN